MENMQQFPLLSVGQLTILLFQLLSFFLSISYIHKHGAAKDVFAKVLELCPNDVEVMTLHANIYLVEGKVLEAENRLNQVLALNPDYPLALYFLGAVYNEKGEYEKAIYM